MPPLAATGSNATAPAASTRSCPSPAPTAAGRARSPDDVADLLVAIKEQHPKLPVRAVIDHARASGQLPDQLELAPSTVHRMLDREGLMRRRTEAPSSNDRRRFAFARVS